MEKNNKKAAGVPAGDAEVLIEDDRAGMSVATLKRAITDHLFYSQAKFPAIATEHDWYKAVAYAVRDRLLRGWVDTQESYLEENKRLVFYLSAEFLMGPALHNSLVSQGMYGATKEACEALDLDLEALIDSEEEPGLGNGGLGRLAACYLDSLATLQVPAIGYGIRYEFGIFDQEIRDGWQVEITDKWLRLGNPWEIPRPERACEVSFGGHTERYEDENSERRVRWLPNYVVKAIPYDTPIPGYGVPTVNTLRLWSAEACESFDFQQFNIGDYYGAVESKVRSENLTKVLYPNDEQLQGKELRLQQQYFFVSCALQDMIRIHQLRGEPLETLHEKFTAQLNDTHPSVAIAELMRVLVDEHQMRWDDAWGITTRTFAYTNHTLLPEALETWDEDLFRRVLPRHLEIIYEINDRFLDEVRRRYPNDEERVRRMSLIDDNNGRRVRMAHLACVGSYAVNGVAALHTELLTKNVLRDFYDFDATKFSNKTNGATPRRFLLVSNPKLARIISARIGTDWVTDLAALRDLEAHVDDAAFRAEWLQAKRDNKVRLARMIKDRTDVIVDPDSLFDIQVKRLHEYKRQHLNVLNIITQYLRIKRDPNVDIVPRTFIFGGKAAPGYVMAKLIIKLIHSVADVVNADPDVRDRLKVVFFPDYNVKNAERIYPAADLSEQISTAGKEASGTGNMKFALNGALTIGTLDGANVEIREEVGPENFFLFGLTAREVEELRTQGYDPQTYVAGNPALAEVLEFIGSDTLSKGDRELFRPLLDSLLQRDEYLLFADYQAYVDCQDRVGKAYRDQDAWTRVSILNSARVGKFSSDRSIREYCEDIWKVQPILNSDASQ